MDEMIYCPECHKRITGYAKVQGLSMFSTVFCCNPECSRCGLMVFVDAIRDWRSLEVKAAKYQDPEISPIRKIAEGGLNEHGS